MLLPIIVTRVTSLLHILICVKFLFLNNNNKNTGYVYFEVNLKIKVYNKQKYFKGGKVFIVLMHSLQNVIIVLTYFTGYYLLWV